MPARLGQAPHSRWSVYPHILPVAQRRLNILPAFREQFWEWSVYQKIRLHSDFHHLNSSQALCFNLFFPLLTQDGHGLSHIVKALGLTGVPVPGACFEFVPDSIEGTNFDFVIPLASGGRILFEVKYTETAFGSAKEDDEHRRKFQNVYYPRIAGRFEPSFCAAGMFLKNYQILRNLWHLDLASDDTAVFLFPRANRSLARTEATLRSCLLESFHSRAIVVYIEDLISALDADVVPRCKLEAEAFSQFRLKYLPTSSSLEKTSAASPAAPTR